MTTIRRVTRKFDANNQFNMKHRDYESTFERLMKNIQKEKGSQYLPTEKPHLKR